MTLPGNLKQVKDTNLSLVLQPWVGLGLLKQMLPRPLSWADASQFLQTSFLASSSTPSSHLDFGQPHPHWPPGFVHDIFLGNSVSYICTT